MESLFATYASSDEEEASSPKPYSKLSGIPPAKPFSKSIPPPKASSSSSSLFSSLPPPKTTTTSSSSSSSTPSNSNPPPKPSSSFFSSLPPPKSSPSSSSSTIFSSRPAPKSHQPNPSTSDSNLKRVVQFKPLLKPSLLNEHDLDDEEDEKKKKESKPTQASSSLFSIIPPPKNSLCLVPVASSASARRSVVEANVPMVNAEVIRPEEEKGSFETYGNYESVWVDGSVETQAYEQLDSDVGSNNATGWVPSDGSYENYANYGGNGSNENYANHGGNWDYASTVTMEAAGTPGLGVIAGKRRRNEVPLDIVEVKQDELIKDRPREDQVKLTGIAFGPSYQPVSSKGKPTKLHKRKHQIGSLYHDMKQKEMELAERRSRGFLTKKETQAKYGW